MIWSLKVITDNNKEITINGDSEQYKDQVINNYWDTAREMILNNYRNESEKIK